MSGRNKLDSRTIGILAVLFGLCLFSLPHLDLSYPDRNTSREAALIIETKHPYGDELTVEREITVPLESALSPVPDITGLDSVSRREMSRITCRFKNTGTLEAAYPVVREAVHRTARKFPGEIGNPLIIRSGGDEPAFTAAFPFTGADQARIIIEAYAEVPECGRVLTSGIPAETIIIAPSSSRHPPGFSPAAVPPLVRTYGTVLDGGWTRDFAAVSEIPIVPGTAIEDLYRVYRSGPGTLSEGRINGTPVMLVSVFSGSGKRVLRMCRLLGKTTANFPGGTVIYSGHQELVRILSSAAGPAAGLLVLLAAVQYFLLGRRRNFGTAFLILLFQAVFVPAVSVLTDGAGIRDIIAGTAAGWGITLFICLPPHPRSRSFSFSPAPSSSAAAVLLGRRLFSDALKAAACVWSFSAPLTVIFARQASGVPPVSALRVLKPLSAAMAGLVVLTAVLAFVRPATAPPFSRAGTNTRAPLTAFLRGRPALSAAVSAVLCLALGTVPFTASSPAAVRWDRDLAVSVFFPEGTPSSRIRSNILLWEGRLRDDPQTQRVIIHLTEERTRVYVRFSRGISRQAAQERLLTSARGLARYCFPDWEQDTRPRITARISGPDWELLTGLAESAAAAAADAAGPGPGDRHSAIFHFRNAPEALFLTADRTKMSAADINFFPLYVQLFWRFSGGVAGKYLGPRGVELADIRFHSAPGPPRVTAETLTKTAVHTPGGNIGLGTLAELSFRRMPGTIYRSGLQRYAAVSFFGPRRRTRRFYRTVTEAVRNLTLPSGYGISLEYPSRENRFAWSDIFLTFLVTAASMAAVSLTLFRRTRPAAAAAAAGMTAGAASGCLLLLPGHAAGTIGYLIAVPAVLFYLWYRLYR